MTHHALAKGDKVLCVGCGNGFEVVTYLLADMDAYGTEVHDIDVPVLKDRIINAVCPDLPFKDNEFKLVQACEVLEHIPTELTTDFIKECLRVGEMALFTTSTIDDPPYHTHINHHPPEWWLDKLYETGCEISNFQYNPHLFLIYEDKTVQWLYYENRMMFICRSR
jgi:ubiquinone/menaquinone biosynthesis C-methylase UbiE